MALGALLDAGLPLDDLKRALGSLALGDVDVRAEQGAARRRLGDEVHACTSTSGPTPLHHGTRDTARHAATARTPHRHLPKIFTLIDGSALSRGRARSREGAVPAAGEAEAAIHQMPVEKVHLHEVGALDSIIDIVGAVFALEWVGADRIVCSPLNVGGGMVHSAHGVFPVPAPATVQLLGDAPVYSGAVQKELVTPTGALIATDLRRRRSARCRR